MGVQSPSTLPTLPTPVNTEGALAISHVIFSYEHTLYTSQLMKAKICSVTLFNQCYDFQRGGVNARILSKFDHTRVFQLLILNRIHFENRVYATFVAVFMTVS